MMRSRMIREGSVGLFILGGVALFIGLAVWLRGVAFGRDSYSVIVEFQDASGLQQGAGVRYRGVQVGTINAINPRANGVDVSLSIADAELRMPNEVMIEANQAGLITETVIDITPLRTFPANTQLPSPLAPDCDSTLIICNNDRLAGQMGVSLNQLIRSTENFTNAYSDPAFIANLNAALANASLAATEFSRLSQDLSALSRSAQQEIRGVSATTQTTAQNLNTIATTTSQDISRAANQLGATAEISALQINRLADSADLTAVELRRTAEVTSLQINRLADTADLTAGQFNQLANTAGLTANEFNQLARNLNTLVVENREGLTRTLTTLSTTSDSLNTLLIGISPTLERFNTTIGATDTQQLIQNLEVLTANAAQASANLRDISTALNDPTNLVLLQQTLDSARATFENTQKITADLDELTGDPQFRQNLIRLVNGLSSLVSSSQELQQQVYSAQVLEPMNAALQNQPSDNNSSKTPTLLLGRSNSTASFEKFTPKSGQRSSQTNP